MGIISRNWRWRRILVAGAPRLLIQTVVAADLEQLDTRAAQGWVSHAIPTAFAVDCIDSLNSNAGKRLVQGVEVTATYEIPTEHFGKFTFSGGYNHFFTWKVEPLAGTGAHSFLGTYNNGSLPFGPGAIPYNKGFLRGEWEWRGFDFVATGNYIGDFEDDPTFIAGNTPDWRDGRRPGVCPPSACDELHHARHAVELRVRETGY